MKHHRLLFMGAAIFLCFSLLAPLNAFAASSQKNSSKSQKSLVKKNARQSVSASKSAKHKKTASRKNSKSVVENKISLPGPKSLNKAAIDKDRQLPDFDRAIWQKRAKESEILTGKASWYGKDFHNKATASGVSYDMYTFTAAHRTLPMGTVVKVTEQNNGKSVMVCVTDRGPFVRGRIIDVSYAAAQKLGIKDKGIGKVKLEVVSDETGAPLNADQAYFIRYASDNGKNKVGPFKAFADAVAMHEALRQAHPEAEVILEKSSH